jgi:hypothetical protein
MKSLKRKKVTKKRNRRKILFLEVITNVSLVGVGMMIYLV